VAALVLGAAVFYVETEELRMARPEKEAAVSEIAARLSGSEAALLTEYRGLTVGQMAEVRNALRDVDADYKVYKNTLTRLAVREVGLEELIDRLEGPTAIAFCRGDAVAAAKAIDDAVRKYPVLSLKGGVLSGRVMGADQARDLARIEPREVQLAKIAMMVNTPVQQTANVLASLLRDLGSMLVQVMSKVEAGNGGGSEEED
jgi:large subunit ribosomal protein L10